MRLFCRRILFVLGLLVIAFLAGLVVSALGQTTTKLAP
jgi:hypothetical protein